MRRIENCGALIERRAAVKPPGADAPLPLAAAAGGATCVAGWESSIGSRRIGGG
jgi:hypothetical protein